MSTADDVSSPVLHLRVPEAWQEVELSEEGFREASERLRQISAQYELQDPHVYSALLRRGFGQLVRAGVILLATFFDVLEPEESGDAATVLMASVSVSTHRLGEGGAMTRQVLRAAMRQQPGAQRVLLLQGPEDVWLGGIPAVYQPMQVRRSSGRRGDPDGVVAVDRYAFGVPGGLAIIDFQTPNIGVIDEFREWFRSIAASVEVA